jgi:NTP pyrophosphatase (non-canonical NTP hydrolase)
VSCNFKQSLRSVRHANVLFCFAFQGKAGKYTEYSHLTGITETNQVTEVSEQHEQYSSSKNSECRTVLTLAQVVSEVPRLADEIANFANDRLWSRYHTPRNLVLALLGEVGELSELLQWANDSTNEPMEPHTIDKLSQELADCSIYLLRLATVCNVVTPLCATLQNRNN